MPHQDRPPKQEHPSRQAFIKAATELTKAFGCHGKIGELPFTREKSSLELDEILWIQVMTGDLEGLKLTLELGANPNYRYKGIHILELASAFADHYGKAIVNQLESYGSKLSVKKLPHKKSS